MKRCIPQDMLYVLELSYNLLSMSNITNIRKTIKSSKVSCKISDANQKLITVAIKRKICTTWTVEAVVNRSMQLNIKLWRQRKTSGIEILVT